MLSRQFFSGVIVFALSAWIVFSQASVLSAANGYSEDEDGMEVLTRGPIHEAFADVSADETQPVMMTSRPVPDPIQEVPPDYRPEGENVQWIPGYWSWDDDRNDFIWVSGVWRDVPPGQQWTPGYWMSADGRNQFVSGYWTDTHPAETVYLPPPPEPPQMAPGSPAYSSDNFWIDGHWLWSNNRYVWQAGYWLRQRPEMVWVPAHYVWTPRGYIFVRGYWDYQIVRRGVMFAPRYYSRPTYRRPHYHYTPSIVLDLDSILLSLFIRRDHHHYYFGDYYDVRYERRGYLPWYSKHATKHGYDPCYRSYRWYRSRDDKHWERDYHEQFQYRRDHREARPPVVYRPTGRKDYDRSRSEKNHMIGRPLEEVVESRSYHTGFTRLEPDHKQDFQERGRKVSASRMERRTAEMAPEKKRKSLRDKDNGNPEAMNISSSPVIGTSGQSSSDEPRKSTFQEKRRIRPDQQTMSESRYYQERKQPRQTEDGRSVQPRIPRSKREVMAVDNQPEIQPEAAQPRRTFRREPRNEEYRMTDHSYENSERRRPETSREQNRVQNQVKQQKRQPVEVEEGRRAPSQRRAERQNYESDRVKNQSGEQPRGKKKVKLPVNPEEQVLEQGVVPVDGQGGSGQ